MTTTRNLRFLATLLICALVTTAAGCSSLTSPATATTSHETSATPSEEPQPPPQDINITLLAAGDVLPHGPVNDSATGPNGIDYSPLLAGIDPWVSGADIALCHMEVPIAPPGISPSGYPVFAAPPELVRDLGEQGWDGCSTASNHSADRGYAGVTATLDAFDQAGMGHVGTARTKEESLSPQYYKIHRDGETVTIAHLSATYGLNGLTAPRGEWSINLINTQRIIQRAKTARDDGADLVVVSLHDGLEYVSKPTSHQKETTQALAHSHQVDLVIGHHAHVTQPLAQLSGGPGGDGMWVAYGLGNLLSNQHPDCCGTASTVGMLLIADIVRTADNGMTRVTDVRWAATTVDRAAGHLLRSTREALATPQRGQLTVAELKTRLRIAQDSAGQDAEEQGRPPLTMDEPPPRVVPRKR